MFFFNLQTNVFNIYGQNQHIQLQRYTYQIQYKIE